MKVVWSHYSDRRVQPESTFSEQQRLGGDPNWSLVLASLALNVCTCIALSWVSNDSTSSRAEAPIRIKLSWPGIEKCVPSIENALVGETSDFLWQCAMVDRYQRRVVSSDWVFYVSRKSKSVMHPLSRRGEKL